MITDTAVSNCFKIKNLLVVFVLLMGIKPFSDCFAQSTRIYGQVIERSTKEPLVGVNVFISGTGFGASTDAMGRYSFTTDLVGKFSLTASFIGFEAKTTDLIISGYNDLKQDFSLVEKVLQFEEVEISRKRDKKWNDLYSDFRRFFIGWDEFADEVEILNKEVVDFEEISFTEVIVNFRSPLVVTNYSTGYKITLETKKIIFNPIEHTGFWNVYARFEDLSPRVSEAIRKEWENNRKKAYTGSSKHFFVSLLRNELKRQKFVILPKSKIIQKEVEPNEIMANFPGTSEIILKYYNVIKITNIHHGIAHNPDRKKLGEVSPTNTQLSTFQIDNHSNLIVFDDYGNIFNPEQVVFFGPWSRDRFSKTLPIEYTGD